MNEHPGRGRMRPRVAVALSGGVDSAVAAALLLEQGFDVIGLTMRLYEPDEDAAPAGVCGGSHVEDARQVADRLGIPHDVIDFRQRFADEVIAAFAGSYARGETPNPCVACNRNIKFGALLEAARGLGAEALATGHYACRTEGAAGPELHRGADESRDQSYFLFAVTREQLSALRFPLADLSKQNVRALAGKLDLPVSSKPDSQDICFVPDGDYARVVRRYRPEAFQPGEIVDAQGRVLGRHEGIARFTVGQRRGLNLHDRAGGNNDPLFVVRLEPKTRRVVVGPRAALAHKEVMLRDVNWLGGGVPGEGLDVLARLRSLQQPAPARFFREQDGGGRLVFTEPAFGVAPGQAGVVYQGSRVLGGGWIESPASKG